ncbi:MAG: hypothetical protein HYV26_10545, partial [Candidatus Hydrogenedentes bacterium]|nr:hypothetical protein [Candidatus Hydrogenedentota bacterium]
PHASLDDAMQYARKIQEEIDSITFSEPCFPTSAKLCFGVVSCQNGSAVGAEQILGEAMRSLLKAKSHRKERICGRDLSSL